MATGDTSVENADAHANLRALWANYVRTRSASVRDGLAQHYDKLARIIAAKTYSGRISDELEFNDYMQFARIGLLESLDRFDPERGVKFETFASRRITGAILNGVESLSEKQKQVSVRQQILRERMSSGPHGSGGSPDPLERLADVAIGLAIGFVLEDTGMYVADERGTPDTGYRSVQLTQLRNKLHAAIGELPDNERKVISLHYLQHEPFESIARSFNLTKGRISQLHHAALRRLRVAVADAGSLSEL